MGVVIFNSNDDKVFDFETEEDIARKEYYIKHNPIWYGMEKSGFNFTHDFKVDVSDKFMSAI